MPYTAISCKEAFLNMKKHSAAKYAAIVVIVALIAAIALTGFRVGIYRVKSILSLMQQGLDISGGMELVYSVSAPDGGDEKTAVSDTMQKMRARLAAYDYEDATVRQIASDQISVQLPAKDDMDAAIASLTRSGKLSFRLNGETVMTGEHVKYAMAGRLQDSNQPAVSFKLDDEGTQIFSEVTGAHVNETMSIYLDDELIASPVISAQVTDGLISISQVGTLKEAKKLAGTISGGELTASIELVSNRTLESELSASGIAVLSAVLAGVVVAVCVYWVVRYRLSGLMAATSFLFCELFTVVLMTTVLGMTFTLSCFLALALAQGVAMLQFGTLLEKISARRAASASTALSYLKEAEKETSPMQMACNAALVLIGLAAQASRVVSVAAFGRILAFGGISAALCSMLVFPGFLRLGVGMCRAEMTKLYAAAVERAEKTQGKGFDRRFAWIFAVVCAALGVAASLLWADTSAFDAANIWAFLVVIVIAFGASALGALAVGGKKCAVNALVRAAVCTVSAAGLSIALGGVLSSDMLAMLIGVAALCAICQIAFYANVSKRVMAEVMIFLAVCAVCVLASGAAVLRVYAIAALCAQAACALCLCVKNGK